MLDYSTLSVHSRHSKLQRCALAVAAAANARTARRSCALDSKTESATPCIFEDTAILTLNQTSKGQGVQTTDIRTRQTAIEGLFSIVTRPARAISTRTRTGQIHLELMTNVWRLIASVVFKHYLRIQLLEPAAKDLHPIIG